MTIRMDPEIKDKFTELCEEFGMSANTAINVFARTVVRSGSIPFTISANPTSSADTEKIIEKFAGKWSGKETTEEIMGNIKSNPSYREPLKF